MSEELNPNDLHALAKSVEEGIRLVRSHKNFWDGKETNEQRRLRMTKDEDSFRLMIDDRCLMTFVRIVKMEDEKPIVFMTYPIVEWHLATTLVELLSKEFEACQEFLSRVYPRDLLI